MTSQERPDAATGNVEEEPATSRRFFLRATSVAALSVASGASSSLISPAADSAFASSRGSLAASASVPDQVRQVRELLGDGSGSILNVKDFGAFGNGTANDTLALQSALDAAAGTDSTASGGTVFLPAGVYLCDFLTVGHGVTLRGVNERASHILASAVGTGHPLISLSNIDRERVTVTQLTIDGNKRFRPGTDIGIHFANTAGSGQSGTVSAFGPGTFVDPIHTIENVTIVNCSGSGLRLEGRGLSVLSHVTVVNNDGDGIHISAPDTELRSCVAGLSGRRGIVLNGSNFRMSGAKAYYSGRISKASGTGIEILASRGSLVNCESQDNTKHGFSFSGCSSIIGVALVSESNGNNCAVSGRNESSAQAGVGFYFGNTSNCEVHGIATSRFMPSFTSFAALFGGSSNSNLNIEILSSNNLALASGSNFNVEGSRNVVDIRDFESSLSRYARPILYASQDPLSVPLTVVAAGDQTAPLVQWTNSAGIVLTQIEANGAINRLGISPSAAAEVSSVVEDKKLRFLRSVAGRMEWGPGGSIARDTNLYRHAAGVLKSDNRLIAGQGLGVGNSIGASKVGVIVRKMEVFDANGASLGFVPIYGSIA